jgi:hypothetical protein
MTHGTPSAYKRGCRCGDCRAAKTAQNARQKQARMLRLAAGDAADFKHGVSGYTNWGCRCEVCVAAARRDRQQRSRTSHQWERKHQRARQQAKSLDAAQRRGYPWTDAELGLAARRDLTDAQVATMTGRTYFGVRDKRIVMRESAEKKRQYQRKWYAKRIRNDPGYAEKQKQRWRQRAAAYLAKHPESRIENRNPNGRFATVEQYNELLENATNNGKQWTGTELEIASREDLTVLQAARMLRRSYDSVRTVRRDLLGKDPRKRMLRDGPDAR